MDEYPEELKYHKEHMWVRDNGAVGITFYAQEQLGEIVYLEVSDVGTEVEAGEQLGEIESRKSVSDLYSPISGTIKEVNSEAINSPEIINDDPYGAGWIAIVEISDPTELENLLSAAEYRELVAGEESP